MILSLNEVNQEKQKTHGDRVPALESLDSCANSEHS